MEKTLKALANKRRLAIIKYLKANGEASVGELAKAIRLSFKSTSRHLRILLAADIIEPEQRSSQMFYRLSVVQKAPAKSIIALL